MVRMAPVEDEPRQDGGAAAGVMDRLKEHESLYGKATRMKQDFPDVWKTRVSKSDSPLDEG